MKAKKEAENLVRKFSPMVNPYMGSGMLSNTHDDDAILWQSKKCALVTCKQRIESLKTELKYLEDVEREIEKL